ncbi:MAG: tRNA (adenosine(37)-N6)-dimethylallyltransferase MiaA [Planctomycetes bacterium]|nr:tRNA (adenosine(37)-N6)-dimethylallyltransferase MiaA [Planctomycetota bacterium]
MQFSPELLSRCWFLIGPTACGKTQIGLRLAHRLDAEILSLDSMAVYRGMDIGTAKATKRERSEVPHHLIDLVDPHEDYTVSAYVRTAEATCRRLIDRGRTPLFVGGTGLYLRSVLRGVFDGPGADWQFRNRLIREAKDGSPEKLHRRLEKADADAAARIHPHDLRRVIRALEVIQLTGRPFSQQHTQPALPPEIRPRRVYWLDPPRDWLYERINRRVTSMMAQGLTDEVKRLLAAEKPLGRTARQALGYREIIDAMDAGKPAENAVESIQTRTRQFAKRQFTWFRNLVECRAVAMTGTESAEEIVERLLSQAAESPQEQ